MEDRRYEAVCPYCQKIIYVKKSIGMHMGFNFGRGSCCHCNNTIVLHYNSDEDSMTAVTFLQTVNFKDFVFPIATIYKSPADFPGRYVVRIFESVPEPKPTHFMSVCKTYDDCLTEIKSAGFIVKFPRQNDDDPCIVESWIR